MYNFCLEAEIRNVYTCKSQIIKSGVRGGKITLTYNIVLSLSYYHKIVIINSNYYDETQKGQLLFI